MYVISIRLDNFYLYPLPVTPGQHPCLTDIHHLDGAAAKVCV